MSGSCQGRVRGGADSGRMRSSAIAVSGLRKAYGDKIVLDGIDRRCSCGHGRADGGTGSAQPSAPGLVRRLRLAGRLVLVVLMMFAHGVAAAGEPVNLEKAHPEARRIADTRGSPANKPLMPPAPGSGSRAPAGWLDAPSRGTPRHGLPPIRLMSSPMLMPCGTAHAATCSLSTGSGRSRRASSAISGNPALYRTSTTCCLVSCTGPPNSRFRAEPCLPMLSIPSWPLAGSAEDGASKRGSSGEWTAP